MKKITIISIIGFSIFKNIVTATTIHIPADYPTIQEGLDNASEGDTVLVAAGTYVENITWPATNSIKLIGSGEEDCIIDGDQQASVIHFGGLSTENFETGDFSMYPWETDWEVTGEPYEGSFSAKSTNSGFPGYNNDYAWTTTTMSVETNVVTVDEITFFYKVSSEANYDYLRFYIDDIEQGMWSGEIEWTQATYPVSAGNHTFKWEYSKDGWETQGADRGWIDGIVFPVGTNLGGIIDTTTQIKGFRIQNGSANFNINTYRGGGGIHCVDSSPHLKNVTISGNSGGEEGGGIFFKYSSAKLSFVTISENMAEYGGGIYCNLSSNPSLTNVTLTDNSGAISGGGICSFNNSKPSLINCIMWNNIPTEIYPYSNSIIDVFYSDIQYGWAGEGNINADPLFIPSWPTDYTLPPGSPCIDAGTSFFIFEGDTIINVTEDEYFGSVPDMGSKESNHDPNLGRPEILSVDDVPNDQGGRVYIHFLGSFFDTDTLNNRVEVYTVERHDDSIWVSLNSFSTYGEDNYTTEATTLKDSSSQDNGMTIFRVIAGMDEGNFASEPDSGYSVDNIAPEAPLNLIAEGNGEDVIDLFWDASEETDFNYFRIYRDTDPGFIPNTPIAEIIETFYSDTDVDVNSTYYYKLSAVDIHDNESEYSDEVNASVLSINEIILPEKFSLHQNYPNPFNPVTTIRYDLAEISDVRLVIYDLLGREVIALLNKKEEAGFKSVVWDGLDNSGNPVSTGVYIYRISAGDYSMTRKMVLLK